jgi:hypothetical protein
MQFCEVLPLVPGIVLRDTVVTSPASEILSPPVFVRHNSRWQFLSMYPTIVLGFNRCSLFLCIALPRRSTLRGPEGPTAKRCLQQPLCGSTELRSPDTIISQTCAVNTGDESLTGPMLELIRGLRRVRDSTSGSSMTSRWPADVGGAMITEVP